MVPYCTIVPTTQSGSLALAIIPITQSLMYRQLKSGEPVSGFVTPYVVASTLDSWSKILSREKYDELFSRSRLKTWKKRALGCVTNAPNCLQQLRNLVLENLTNTPHYFRWGLDEFNQLMGPIERFHYFCHDGWESGRRVNS